MMRDRPAAEHQLVPDLLARHDFQRADSFWEKYLDGGDNTYELAEIWSLGDMKVVLL